MFTFFKASGAKVLTFLGDNGKQLRRWVKRNERTLIIAIFPTSVVVLDARSGRNDAKKDVEHVEKNVDRLGENIDRLGENVDRLGENIDRLGKGLADTNRMLADTNDTIKKMDGKLTLLEHNQKFMQAFALQSAAKIMKAIGGNRSDREEANQFIKDGEEIMGCMERGGEGFGGGESSTLSGIYADRG